jgi:hypothetical protein
VGPRAKPQAIDRSDFFVKDSQHRPHFFAGLPRPTLGFVAAHFVERFELPDNPALSQGKRSGPLFFAGSNFQTVKPCALAMPIEPDIPDLPSFRWTRISASVDSKLGG